MTPADLDYLTQLRRMLFDHLAWLLARDSYAKRYEGTFEVCFPSYFDDNGSSGDPEPWGLNLHCYVTGPSRHYTWRAASMSECLDAARLDIEKWMIEDRDNAALEDAEIKKASH